MHRRSTDGATLGSGGAPSSGGVPGGGAAADDQTEREGWFSPAAAETAPSAAGRPPFATRCHASRRGVQKVPKGVASLNRRPDPSGREHPPPAPYGPIRRPQVLNAILASLSHLEDEIREAAKVRRRATEAAEDPNPNPNPHPHPTPTPNPSLNTAQGADVALRALLQQSQDAQLEL